MKKAAVLDKLLALFSFLALGALFYTTLKEIARICYTDDDYSHGLLLPLVSLYMLWDQKDYIKEKLLESKNDTANIILPLFVLLGGLLVFLTGQATGINYTSWISFFPIVLSVIYLTFGKTFAFISFAPVMLLLMAKPLPDSLILRIFWPLQVLAARVSKVVLSGLGVPTYLRGNIIEIPGMKLLVEEACSGMRSAMAMLTLAFIINYFLKITRFQQLIMVAFSLLVAVILNVFRVATTGVLAHFYDPESATGFFHTFSGLIVFIVGLPLIYSFGYFLEKINTRKAN